MNKLALNWMLKGNFASTYKASTIRTVYMQLKLLTCIVVVLILICSTATACNNETNDKLPTDTTIDTVVPEESTKPEESEPESETTAPDTIEPETSPPETEEPETTLPPIEEETVPPVVEPEVVPDIITTIEVNLYNDYHDDFNLVDGRAYLEDIVGYLRQYAPDGMFISAASAMAYTEGGSGKKGVYPLTNNCFGIRAYSSWDGYVYARSTGLVYKDYDTAVSYGASDFFRAYNSMEESVIDYIKLISGNYYGKALETNSPAEYFSYVLSKGYGEPELYEMWLGVMDIYDLAQYDVE